MDVSGTIETVLAHKSPEIYSVSPEATVYEAIALMAEKNVGALLVMESEQLVGIISERDYSRKVVLKGKSSTDTRVAEIMSTDFPHVSPQDTIEHCMQLLAQKNIRYLPVFINGELGGIVSINDLVKETILSQQETITHLQDYLHTSL